jgi:hypothetical protein
MELPSGLPEFNNGHSQNKGCKSADHYCALILRGLLVNL